VTQIVEPLRSNASSGQNGLRSLRDATRVERAPGACCKDVAVSVPHPRGGSLGVLVDLEALQGDGDEQREPQDTSRPRHLLPARRPQNLAKSRLGFRLHLRGYHSDWFLPLRD